MLNIRLALVAACLGVPAGATTLLDGGFETKGAALPVNSYCYDNVAAGDGLCAASPWTNIASNSGVIKSGAGAWGGVAAATGSYYGFIQVAGSLGQSFTATEDGTATVSWVDTNRIGHGSLQTYGVWIDQGMTSQALGTFTSAATGSWVARTSSAFTLVNGASYTLRFTGTATADATTFLDDVILNVTPSAAVPEPASWAMLIAGFGLVGAAARRRRIAIAA